MDAAYIERMSIPEPNSGCWLWLGEVRKDGYGVARFGPWRVKNHGRVFAHRLSWRAHNGDIPAGLHILHKCDVPSCVNPQHLYPGTDRDNHNDKVARGRACWQTGNMPRPFGEGHHKAKLTADQVREIRRRWDAGEDTQCGMAREFGVYQNAIREIVMRNVWRSV